MKLCSLVLAPAALAALATMALPAAAQDIVGGQPTQNFKAVDIGVPVAPDWVLTARHAIIGVGGTWVLAGAGLVLLLARRRA